MAATLPAGEGELLREDAASYSTYDRAGPSAVGSSSKLARRCAVAAAAMLVLGLAARSGRVRRSTPAASTDVASWGEDTFCVAESKDMPGYHFDHAGTWETYLWSETTADDDACADLCTADADCVAFSHNRMTDECFLYQEEDVGSDVDKDTVMGEENSDSAAAAAAYTKVGNCTECVACGAGAEVVDECNRLSDRTCRCTAGFSGIEEANSTMTCSACEAGTFSAPGASSCTPCSSCGFGTELVAECTSTVDTTCRCHSQTAVMQGGDGDDFECEEPQCTAGSMFRATPSAPCQACSTCGIDTELVSACTPTSDTVCRCQPGSGALVVAGTPGVATCTPCVAGSTYAADAGISTSCAQCTVCGARSEVVTACTPTDDTVCRCQAGSGGVVSATAMAMSQGQGSSTSFYGPDDDDLDELRPLAGLDDVDLLYDEPTPTPAPLVSRVVTCASCIPGSTFAPNAGQLRCQPCLECGAGTKVALECTATSDRLCACDVGYSSLQVLTSGFTPGTRDATCVRDGDGNGDGDGVLEVGEMALQAADPDGDGDADGDGRPY